MDYQICNRCVMDNKSDDSIVFDDIGHCNYCNTAINSMGERYFPNDEGKKKLNNLIEKLINEGQGKQYDCLMGISGGLDSAYLAYLGYSYGLRILAVHVDDGFDTDIAKENIQKIGEACNMDIVFEKPDKEQYFDLTRAFIRAGVPNIAIPQDNLIFAYLYKYAKKYNLKYFLSGGNFALESILQRGNTHDAYDKIHIKDINRKFGKKGIDRLPITSGFERKIKNRLLYKINEIRPLDYIDYNKNRAIKDLKEFCDYDYYGGKHYESLLTMFMQKYYLPKKFDVDKRTSHLSSLIVSGQITREEALAELEKPLYVDDEMLLVIEKILELIKTNKEEFNYIMDKQPKKHKDYKTSNWKYVSNFARLVRGY